jgi:hypothetical protein
MNERRIYHQAEKYFDVRTVWKHGEALEVRSQSVYQCESKKM